MTKNVVKFGDITIQPKEITTLNKIRKSLSESAKSIRVFHATLLVKYEIKSGTNRAGQFNRDFVEYMNLDKKTFESVNKVSRYMVENLKDPKCFDAMGWEEMKEIADRKDPKKVANGKKGGEKSKPKEDIKKTPEDIIFDLYVVFGTKATESAVKGAKARFMAQEQKNQLGKTG